MLGDIQVLVHDLSQKSEDSLTQLFLALIDGKKCLGRLLIKKIWHLTPITSKYIKRSVWRPFSWKNSFPRIQKHWYYQVAKFPFFAKRLVNNFGQTFQVPSPSFFWCKLSKQNVYRHSWYKKPFLDYKRCYLKPVDLRPWLFSFKLTKKDYKKLIFES